MVPLGSVDRHKFSTATCRLKQSIKRGSVYILLPLGVFSGEYRIDMPLPIATEIHGIARLATAN